MSTVYRFTFSEFLSRLGTIRPEQDKYLWQTQEATQ